MSNSGNGSGGESTSTWPGGGDVTPSSEYGVREFVNQLGEALRIYQRHQGVINAVLPGPIASALGLLAAASEAIKALNPEGPA